MKPIKNDFYKISSGWIVPKTFVLGLSFLLLFSVFFWNCAQHNVTKSYGFYDMANNAFQNGNMIQALADLKEAKKYSPEDPDVEQLFGLVVFARGNFDNTGGYLQKAEQHFLEAIRLYEGFEPPVNQDFGRLTVSDAHVNLSAVYMVMEKWDEVIEHASFAAKDPYHRTPDRANFNIGYAYFQKKMYDKAISYLKLSVSQNRQFAGGHKTLGEVYLEKSQYNNAVDSLRRAIKLFPRYAEAYYYLGIAYQKQRKFLTAKKIFDQCAKIKPDNDFSEKCKDFL